MLHSSESSCIPRFRALAKLGHLKLKWSAIPARQTTSKGGSFENGTAAFSAVAPSVRLADNRLSIVHTLPTRPRDVGFRRKPISSPQTPLQKKSYGIETVSGLRRWKKCGESLTHA